MTNTKYHSNFSILKLKSCVQAVEHDFNKVWAARVNVTQLTDWTMDRCISDAVLSYSAFVTLIVINVMIVLLVRSNKKN